MSTSGAPGIGAFPDELDGDRWLDPFDWYREMRESDPVRYDPGRRTWDVFRYDDVKRILDDDDTFSVDPERASDFQEPEDEGQGLLLETMLLEDPPRHDELRSVVDDAFSPRELQDLKPRIHELTAELLDEAVEDDEMDVVDDLAYPLPVTVIAEMLGVPPEDQDQFKEWSDLIVGAAGEGADGEFVERQGNVGQEMATYFFEMVADRRENPTDDLMSTIVNGETQSGDQLTETEVLGTCILLLVAGNITTTHLITNAVRCFTNQDLWADLGNDEVPLRPAIEEVLRYRSPVQAMTRYATEDVTVGGESIDEGDRVVVWLGSANRDDGQFEAADEFRPGRSPNQHLGFGHGTHYCLGAPLARMEANVALGEMFDRVADVERTETDLTPTRSAFIYGVESLPIRFEST